MEWLNLHIAKHLRSPAAIGSSPEEVGTWVRVLGYCCEQENGGRIVGGALWKDRQWQQLCAVTIRELRAADRLICFDGEDVVVNGYSVEKEAEVIRGRRRASAGAMARWGTRNGTCSSNAQASARAYAEGEREGEVGKGSTPAAAAAVVGQAHAPGGDGAKTIIEGLDRAAIRQAVAGGQPLEVIAAFGGTRDDERDRQWLVTATGLRVVELAAILWVELGERRPVRQPSGLRAARERWEADPPADRRETIAIACADLGIPNPFERKTA